MKEIIRPPKQLNLPRDIYEDLEDFVPYPSDDPDIITKRRSERGMLVADMELRGVRVLQQLNPAQFDSLASQHAARDIIARVGIGSAHYDLAREDAMFYPLRLGLVAEGARTRSSERRYASQQELAAQTLKHLTLAEMMASAHYRHLHTPGMSEHAAGAARSAGRYIGNAALSSLVYDMPGTMEHRHPVDIQLTVRDKSLALLSEIEDYGRSISARPSVAQLMEPDSPVAVDIRRHAPRDVRRAFEAAAAEHPEQLAT